MLQVRSYSWMMDIYLSREDLDQVFDNPKMERTKQFLSSYS